MVEEEKRQDWDGASGLMFNVPYYGLDRAQKLHAICYEHLHKCKICRDEWDQLWQTIPESKATDELAELINRNHNAYNK